MFSKACEYGMRAAIYVAQQSDVGNKVGVKAIAEAIESPLAFTGKIMQQLTGKGIISSVKGPHGGFFIDESTMKATKLNEIITLFDGSKAYKGCILGLKTCSSEQPCALHKEAETMLYDLQNLLETKSLYDVLYTEGNKNQFRLKV